MRNLSVNFENSHSISIQMKTELEDLFRSYTGHDPETISQLTSSGSNRTYFRLAHDGFSCIGVAGTVAEENDVFCALAAHFASKGINVPEVYAVSADRMYYLQEDLGNESLFDRLSAGRLAGNYSSEDVALLKKTISVLPEIQIKGAEGWDFSRCFHGHAFNSRSVMFDLDYFKFCFLKTTGMEFDEERLEDDFVKLAGILAETPADAFMYRDFQSRNVMLKDGEPYFIDFQGGRRGPVYYDVASFVWQARSDFPEALKNELVDTYLASLRKYRTVDEEAFRKELKLFVFFRMMQVLGAYGFRGYFEKKRHFLESIPYAVASLRGLLPYVSDICPYLSALLEKMIAMPRFSRSREKGPSAQASCLKVRIFSFSYRKGIPEDVSGNGGGYVFDCRAIHNPGKYDRFKSLTGMDREVKAFLEGRGEVTPFLENVYSLADAHVEKYISRGFTDLMFCFGCTGGQHRSVYCAEALAGHLSSKYGIGVELFHREQGVKKTF